MILPDNVKIIFEEFCSGCDKCDLSWNHEIDLENGHKLERITCKNIETCRNARSILAAENIKEPFA